MVPMVVYVFLNNTPTVAIVFAVWCLLVSLCDNVLKPLMLARGVDIPIPVILIGALAACWPLASSACSWDRWGSGWAMSCSCSGCASSRRPAEPARAVQVLRR